MDASSVKEASHLTPSSFRHTPLSMVTQTTLLHSPYTPLATQLLASHAFPLSLVKATTIFIHHASTTKLPHSFSLSWFKFMWLALNAFLPFFISLYYFCVIYSMFGVPLNVNFKFLSPNL